MIADKYLGKRKLVGHILTERLAGRDVVVLDLVGLDRQTAIDFADVIAKTRDSDVRRVAILAVHDMAGEGYAMTRYYGELENKVRAGLCGTSIPITSYSAPAIIEELAPYFSHFGEVYGSYLEEPMPWVAASEVAEVICHANNRESGERIKISSTSRQTVEQALNALGADGARKYIYRHLAPNILGEVYRQRGLDRNDGQIADQLPYYQYYVSQLVYPPS